MMNIRQLEYFLAVAEELNFTKAAKRFFISQTAMTLQIKSLEDQLELKLFDRTKKSVKLTPSGKVFVEEAKAIISRTEEAKKKAHSAATGVIGTLNIGFIKKYEDSNLGALLNHFHSNYPNVSFNLFRDIPSSLYEGIASKKYDIIFCIDFGVEKNPAIKKIKIHSYPLYVVLYPSHPLAYKKSIYRSELTNESFIMNELTSAESGGDTLVLGKYIESGFLPKIAGQYTDIENIFLMVSAGIGIAILPEYAIRGINSYSNLISIPLIGEHETIDIILAWLESNTNPVLSNFISLVSGNTFSEK